MTGEVGGCTLPMRGLFPVPPLMLWAEFLWVVSINSLDTFEEWWVLVGFLCSVPPSGSLIFNLWPFTPTLFFHLLSLIFACQLASVASPPQLRGDLLDLDGPRPACPNTCNRYTPFLSQN